MKTNKHQTLLLIKTKQSVRAQDLVKAFGYSAATARSYLSHLKRQELLERSERGHRLTDKGGTRLQFFDVSGCADAACPLCLHKSGQFTCPRCDYRLAKEEIRVRPEQDFLVVVRHAGVYCPGPLIEKIRKLIPKRNSVAHVAFYKMYEDLVGSRDNTAHLEETREIGNEAHKCVELLQQEIETVECLCRTEGIPPADIV